MRKPLLHALFATMAVALAAVLCACGSGGVDPSEGVTFQNDLDARIEAVYITSTEVDTWGEPIDGSSLGAGKSVVFDGDVLPETVLDTYDVGVLDENDMVYEFYRVPIVEGNKLTIFVGTDNPVLVVTDESGNDTAIDGYSYQFEG